MKLEELTDEQKKEYLEALFAAAQEHVPMPVLRILMHLYPKPTMEGLEAVKMAVGAFAPNEVSQKLSKLIRGNQPDEGCTDCPMHKSCWEGQPLEEALAEVEKTLRERREELVATQIAPPLGFMIPRKKKLGFDLRPTTNTPIN